ncbi:hypothetical protein B0H16DRAFT_1763634 [Mycena metata]|uniref:Uncharacterized protein n=1 Tax=Mycena metata TaxID=1033252 RepID=A0AAD7NT50_9AGAR|nr:hypothetical protein B0H16DRAFT_1763634 [Mycena metata]
MSWCEVELIFESKHERFIRRIRRIRQMPSLRIAPHPSGPLKTFRIAPHLNDVFQNLNDMSNSLKATCQILQDVEPFTIILSLKMLSSLKAPVESFTIIPSLQIYHAPSGSLCAFKTGRNEKIDMVWLLTVHVVQGANIYIHAVVAYIFRAGVYLYLYLYLPCLTRNPGHRKFALRAVQTFIYDGDLVCGDLQASKHSETEAFPSKLQGMRLSWDDKPENCAVAVTAHASTGHLRGRQLFVS